MLGRSCETMQSVWCELWLLMCSTASASDATHLTCGGGEPRGANRAAEGPAEGRGRAVSESGGMAGCGAGLDVGWLGRLLFYLL